MLTVGSLFSGVGGFDLGFEQAGFRIAWQCEADAAARAVLRRRWPDVPCYDDVRTIGASTVAPVDVLVGGFPCQDVSVAGARAGLGGSRSGLFFEFMRLAEELQPSWVVIENVPGLLTSHGGLDFHAVLSALADVGLHDRAYRILDSRYFGVAQRRRRVFIVGRARAEFGSAAAVLFESAGRGGDSATGSAPGAHPAAASAAGAAGAGNPDRLSVLPLSADAMHGRTGEALTPSRDSTGRERLRPPGMGLGADGDPSFTLPASAVPGVAYAFDAYNQAAGPLTHTLRSGLGGIHSDAIPVVALDNHSGQVSDHTPTLRSDCHGGEPLVAGSLPAYSGRNQIEAPYVAATLNSGGNSGGFRTEPGAHLVTVAATLKQRGRGYCDEVIDNLQVAEDDDGLPQVDADDEEDSLPVVQPGAGVRRLTPLECERLQGFPDGWTCLCEAQGATATCRCPDSPRYKQMGNAVTVPVIRWLAARLLAVHVSHMAEQVSQVAQASAQAPAVLPEGLPWQAVDVPDTDAAWLEQQQAPALMRRCVAEHCESGSCCYNPNECDGNDCWLLRQAPGQAPGQASAQAQAQAHRLRYRLARRLRLRRWQARAAQAPAQASAQAQAQAAQARAQARAQAIAAPGSSYRSGWRSGAGSPKQEGRP